MSSSLAQPLRTREEGAGLARLTFLHMIMSEQDPLRPTFHQLYWELQPVRAKWYSFGLSLGFEPCDLDVIAANRPDVEQRLAAVCNEWLQRHPSGTWKNIIMALENGKWFSLARKLEEKFINTHTELKPTGVLLSPPQSDIISCPGSRGTDRTGMVNVPKIFREDVEYLVARFMYLLSTIQAALRHKLNNKELDLEIFGRFISNILSVPYKPHYFAIGRDKIEAVFSPLCDHLSFLHTGLFRHIDKVYLKCSLASQIKWYDNEIDKFLKSTKIIEFKKIVQTKWLGKGIPVILRLSRRWDRCTLVALQHFINYLFGDNSSLVKFSIIHHTVLTITYTVPGSLLLPLIIMASRKKKNMKWVGVLSVQVGTILMKVNEDDGSDIDPSAALIEASGDPDVLIIDYIKLIVNIGGNANFKDKYGQTPLTVAAYLGNVFSLCALIQSNVNVNMQSLGQTALHLSSFLGHHQCVDLLLQSKGDPNIQDTNGATALHAACYPGHHQCINLLLHSKADPDIQDNIGATALHISSQEGHHQCINLLLQSKADPNIQGIDGRTALLIAAQGGHHLCVNLLLQSKAIPDIQGNNGATALDRASELGYDQCVDLLLQAKADPNIQANDGATALYMACQNGHHQCVHLLLQAKADPNIQTNDGTTALCIACQKNYHLCVDILLKSKANPDVQCNDGRTALLIASQNGYYQCVNLLLRAKANPNILTIKHTTALYAASLCGRKQCVDLLLQSKADPNIQDINGATALFFSSQEGHHQCVNLLLQSKADPDIQVHKGGAALHIAVSYGRHQCVDLLLQSKADPNVQDINGVTALQIASYIGNHQCVDLLLQSKANPNIQDKNGVTALHVAVSFGHYQSVNLLLQSKADPNIPFQKYSPLSIACLIGHLSIVSLLLQHGALTDIPEVISPLLTAVDKGDYDILKALINAGANLNPQSECHGATPLMIASGRGILHMVKLLLQSGADVLVEDKLGFTAYDAAVATNRQRIVTLLALKINEQTQKCLSLSEESNKSRSTVFTIPQKDDDMSLQSHPSDEKSAQTLHDSSESVSEPHQTSSKPIDLATESKEETYYQLNRESILNHVNTMISSLQDSWHNMLTSLQEGYKSFTKTVDLVFENQPGYEQIVH